MYHHSRRYIGFLLSVCGFGLLWAITAQAGLHPSYSAKAEIDTVEFYNTHSYDRSVPNPNDYLQYPVGKWPARYHEFVLYFQELAAFSDRLRIETHETTHEGRTLYNLFISSPENIRNLEAHREQMDKLADPRAGLSNSALSEALAGQPAFAWLGYSIHGDEISGSDAAIRLAYHLAAANDSATLHLLDNVIIIIDPCENPDGRERYLSMLETYKSHVPNYDSRSAQHGGVWPWGRANHYLFDLNRDWILLTQPETKGRVRTILEYHPVMVVDGHEMGSNATFLFSPPRQPINYNTPENVMKWYSIFRDDQAQAFDERGWPYYTGEWNEQWYIGYGSAWPTFFGTVGILYEQAGVDGQVVRQRDNYLLSYHEAINHQFTSSIANLQTVANNREELLRDYRSARNNIVTRGERSNLTFIFVPDEDELKMQRLISSLLTQGIEVHRAAEEFPVGDVTDIYQKKHSMKRFPAGTYLVSTAQPQGALAKAMLEFDLHLKPEFLEEERRELEKHGDTRMYEVSAWCVPMAYDVDAYMTTSRISVQQEPVTGPTATGGRVIDPGAQYGFIVDMQGEKTYRMLNGLFGEHVTVYASEKAFTIEGRRYRPGALVLRRRGNPDDLPNILTRLARETGVDVHGVNTGLSTEGSHLGAPTFRLLQQPKVAILTGAPLSFTSVGSLWFTIDRELEIPHSLLHMDEFMWTDISPYNVLVFPSAWGSGLQDRLGKRGKQKLEEWVEDGGTLILMGSSATWAADTSVALTQVRLKRQVLDKLEDYARALERELAAEDPEVDTMALWHPEEIEAEKSADEEAARQKKGQKEDAEELDKWQRRFRPGGVILRADVDTEHWLAFGMKERVPTMIWGSQAYLSKEPVATVARLTPEADKLRMSGLLWPEARERWAGTAYTTRERKGKGQIVIFAGDPNMRAYWYGTRKMFVNAVLYGPGFTSGFEPYSEESPE